MGFEMSDLFGRDCKLGYGVDEELNYIVPFESTPQNVREDRDDSRWLIVFSLSDQNIISWAKLGLLVSDTYLKYLEHQIVFDQNEYYLIRIQVYTKYEECDGCDKCPDNFPDYVNMINYGMKLWVVVNQNGLPNDRREADNFLNNVLEKKSHRSGRTHLTEQEKQLKCHVLISYQETREMTLGQVFEFVDEFGQRQHPQYECPLYTYSKEIDGHVSNIKNPDGFCYFFENVYTAYRKMGLILEKSGFPTLAELPCDQMTIPAICELARGSNSELKLMTKDLKTTDDKMLIPKIYLVLKRLVQLNKRFVKNVIENRIDIGDEYFFDYVALRPLLRRLNTWKPASCLWTCHKFKSIELKLRRNGQWEDIDVRIDNSLVEPCLLEPPYDTEKIGFVNMSGAVPSSTQLSAIPILKNKCPRSCSDDVRKWICSGCAEVVKISTVYGLTMACKCGSKPFDQNLLTCVHPLHEESIKIEALPEDLRTITKQLKKHQNRYDPDSDKKIKEAVQKLINDHKNAATVADVLTQMRQLTVLEDSFDKKRKIQTQLDGDTHKLIDKYLK